MIGRRVEGRVDVEVRRGGESEGERGESGVGLAERQQRRRRGW